MDNNDFSDLLNKLINEKKVPDNFNEILSNLSNNNDSLNSSKTSPNIDINTIMKIQSIITSLNENNNSNDANLLRSLKPYLNKNRQDKIEEYIQFLNIEKFLNQLGPNFNNQ